MCGYWFVISMKQHTTPLEREILTHYWTTPGPYLNGSEHWLQPQSSAVDRFLRLGLLISVQEPDGTRHIKPNHDALRPYMETLAAVPLPRQAWFVPETPRISRHGMMEPDDSPQPELP